MSKLDVLTLICSLLQILGFILIIAQPGGPTAVLVGIAGFAAVVMYFMPNPEGTLAPTIRFLRPLAALCGVGLILFAFSMA
ncbi:MAG TPA: hypothetical protein PLZ55_02700 [bacterium]|nr:hypothetical protein [bacterium]HPO07551.1 hypothetical protein [bacterium]HQO33353.1 hypothetical protein [bacterium]HQP98726.1 hypothetical protein [bacterium]